MSLFTKEKRVTAVRGLTGEKHQKAETFGLSLCFPCENGIFLLPWGG